MTPYGKFHGSPQRLLLSAALLLLLLTILVIGLISAGVFDPKPLGQKYSRDELNRQVTVVDEYQEHLVHVPTTEDFSVRLSAAWNSGNPDIGYGLQVGDSQHSIIVAVSPLGYVTIMNRFVDNGTPEHDGREFEATDYLLPWQTWPHIASERKQNEIWVDIKDSNLISVRINRELLWTGDLPLSGTDIGFWAGSFEEPAVIDLNYIEVFRPL